MASTQHRYVPLKDPHIIPVHWKFSQNDYNKLKKGNERARSPWRCFMENDVFHIYKGYIGGLEHFRFALNREDDDTYVVSNVESLKPPDFEGLPAEFLDDTQAKVEEQGAKHSDWTTGEVVSLLPYFFDISGDKLKD